MILDSQIDWAAILYFWCVDFEKIVKECLSFGKYFVRNFRVIFDLFTFKGIADN